MVSIAVAVEPPVAASSIRADFTEAGFEIVLCDEASDDLFQGILQAQPDLVVAIAPTPGDTLLESAAMLKKVAPRPFVLFTNDASPGKIERATAAGVHAYVVDGYAPGRLRSVLAVAQARFRHERDQGGKLDGLARDLRERKQVERAKGVLMRSRGLGEAAAFELMRTLAMRQRLRLASVAEAVINLSVGAEAINRSGQLRMLAQRTARCLVQRAHGVHPDWAAANLRESLERLEANVAQLRRTVAERGCDDDIERIAAATAALRDAAEAPDTPLAQVDALAETLTREAETLTGFLEGSGLVTNLRVVNIAGRQRMISQRVGKLCLLLALDDAPALVPARAAALGAASAEFAAGMAELAAMPVHTAGIARWLAAAAAQWAVMAPFCAGGGSPAACVAASESLLEALEALTAAYEEAAQVLIGNRFETFKAVERP